MISDTYCFETEINIVIGDHEEIDYDDCCGEHLEDETGIMTTTRPSTKKI